MGARARLTVLVAAVLLFASSAMVASARSAAPAQVFVRTAIDGDRLAVRPQALGLSVHGSLTLHRVHWVSWGGALAKATATARVHGCVPDCNLGKIAYVRAKVRLSELVSCEGRLVYGRLGYRLGGEVPPGVERGGRFDMRPRGC